MTTITLQVAADAHVLSTRPTTPFGGDARLGVADNTRATYLFFNQPFPRGVRIVSAKLTVKQAGAATGGNRTITVQRADKAWSESRIVYSGRPQGTGATASKTLGDSSVSGRVWDFNVQALMQQVSDGAPWYGLRLTSNVATPIYFWSRNSNAPELTAKLEVEWSDAPDAPTDLSPANGASVGIARPTFRMDYTDPSGEDGLQAVQVQVSKTSSFTSPFLDSGTVVTDVPEWTATSDLAYDSTASWRWRGRVQDASGLWSPWSAAALFGRAAKMTVAIDNPVGTVYTPTPVWSWTVTPSAESSDTQSAFQIWVVDPDDPTEIIWTSGKQASTLNSFAMPNSARLLLEPGSTYMTILRLWGTVYRESTPGDPVYSEARSTFTVASSGTSDVVELTVVKGTPFPALEWRTSSAPDQFVILRNNRTIAIEDRADLKVSGTATRYRFEDRTAKPGTTHTWSVATKTGDLMATPVSVQDKVVIEGVWLYSFKVDELAISIGGDPEPERMDFEADEDVAIMTGYGATVPVMISGAGGIRSPRRRMKGTIRAADLALWERITGPRARTIGLMVKTTMVKVQVFNVVTEDELEWSADIPVSFDMIVVG